MTEIKDLLKLPTPAPSGWTPGSVWDGDTGYITTQALADEPDDFDKLLELHGYDPERYMVSGKVGHTSQVDEEAGLVRTWFKYQVARRPVRDFDIEDVLDQIYIDEPDHVPDAGEWLTIQIADTHIGKSKEAGAGSELIAQRWKESVSRALNSHLYSGVHLAFLGDLIEGYVSQGGANIAETDLNLAEQKRLARHLVSWTIQQALSHVDDVIVSAVPGNHGETTRAQHRPATDSHDIDIVSAVQQAYDLHPKGNRIKWYYPEPHQGHVTYKVGDTTFTAVHGHKFRGGKMAGAEKWWAGMTVNGREPGAAHILMAGHFHGCEIKNYTHDRWIMFSPALETESAWFAESTGARSQPGMLAYLTSGGKPMSMGVM